MRAEAELAKSQLVRREKLLVSHSVSREEYEIFRKDVEARTADVIAAEADVDRRRTNLETRSAIIAVREATAKSRQSNVDRLQELQIFKRIVAPFDGVVTHRTAEVGMLVTAGKESLFVVEDMSRVRIQTNIPQAYSMQARRGAAATISVPESASQSCPRLDHADCGFGRFDQPHDAGRRLNWKTPRGVSSLAATPKWR